MKASAMIDIYMWSTTNSRRATIALEETGLPYRVHPVDIYNREQFTDAYTALNAYQKVPVITVDDGPGGKPAVIFESGAILLYIADQTGQLYGNDAGERLEVQKWFILHMNSSLPAFRFARRYRDLLQRDVERACKVIDGHLANNRYFAPSYSIADIALYPRIAKYDPDIYPVRDHPHLARWLDDIGNRDAVKRGMAQPNGIKPRQ